jgi:ADP-heptose:LPS heptosyltransferase
MVVRFLIVRFSSIGDIVLTTPVIRCLKQQVEGAEIHFATKKQYASILESNPYIDKLHLLDGSLGKLIDELKEEHIDYVIDLHHNLRSSILKLRLHKISFSFDKLNFKKYLLVRWKINRMPDKHIVERYLDTVSLFDVKSDQKGLDYFIPSKDEIRLESLPEEQRGGYVAVVLGAKHNTKKMPIKKVISICQKLQKPVILMGGREDKAEASKIADACGPMVFNACGFYSLNQSASLIRQAKGVISHDTGLMHIAAAFKKSIISVWGNTVPEFGMYPYLPGEHSTIIEVKGLKCRPCSKIGYQECPKKHFRCMMEMNEDKIVALVNEYFV